jgi:hypothetical protein
VKYNTETIKDLARQVSQVFEMAVTENKDQELQIADIESELREMMRAIGAEALSQILSTSAGTPVAELACECGGTLHYQRQRIATITSVFGRIQYERAYYAGCQCGSGQAPVDRKYGLEPGAMTSGLAALLSLAGIEFGFEESRKWLQAYLLFEVSENTIRAETEGMGALQTQREKVLCEQSQQAEYLQARLRETGLRPKRLYGSLDAAKVRIEPRPKAGKKPKREEAWRDLKIGCWYEVEPVPAAQRSRRHHQKQARGQAVLRAQNMRYFCDIQEAEVFGELLWASGCANLADLAAELIFICDGAVWIWRLIEHYFPQAIQIVDWYHAADHLKRLALVAFPTEALRTEWLETVTEDLWQGRIPEVLQACEGLTPACEEAKKEIAYFTNNEHRMQYKKFRSADYLIGSGTVESACKQIVTQRLKKPGAQWNVAGAVQTAKARAVWLSGDWESLCLQRAALPLAF